MNSEANKASIKKSFKGSLRVFLHNRSFLIGSIMILVVVISAIFADVIAPYEYDYADMSKKLLMPCKEFLFGTDDFGRDRAARGAFSRGNRDSPRRNNRHAFRLLWRHSR